jgi:hypothetical protein
VTIGERSRGRRAGTLVDDHDFRWYGVSTRNRIEGFMEEVRAISGRDDD